MLETADEKRCLQCRWSCSRSWTFKVLHKQGWFQETDFFELYLFPELYSEGRDVKCL